MRKFLALFSLVCVFSSLGAQNSFSISPSDTLADKTGPDDFTIYDIYMVNKSSNQIIFSWVPVKVNIPDGWDYAMCDKGICYPGIPGGTMAATDPGDSAFLGLNIYPNGKVGFAFVRCYVYEEGFPDNGDTITWIIESTVSAKNNRYSKNATVAFPNPVNGMLYFSKPLSSLEVYNLSGIKVFESGSEEKNGVDMSQYPAGVYIIKGLTAVGTQTFQILKQ